MVRYIGIGCICKAEKRWRMRHFGTDLIRALDLYQSEGIRRFCHPSCTILSPVSGHLRVRFPGSAGSSESVRTYDGFLSESGESLHNSEVILIPCGSRVELFCEGLSSYLVLQLSPAFLMEAFSKEPLLSETISSAQKPALTQILPDLFALLPLYQDSPERNRLEINRLLFSLLGGLDRVLLPQAEGAARMSPAPSSRQESVDSYIAAHIEKQISLQETAKACGLTPQYLSSFFQKSMNCTFMEYVNRIKAQKAHDWFLRSDLSAEDVCAIVGFKTYSAFCKSMEARYQKSWETLRSEVAPDFVRLPAEEIVRNPPSTLYPVTKPLDEGTLAHKPVYQIRKETIQAQTRPDKPFPTSWKMILNVGSADSIFFEPFLRKLNEFNRIVSFRYCRMYGLFQLVTVYSSGSRMYYGFELIFQNLDSIINAGLIPFLDIGFRQFPGHRNPLSSFAFNSDPADVYYEKLFLILPEFLKAASNRYGRGAVEKWRLEFHFSYQNNRSFTFWQFLSAFRKIEEAARKVLPNVRIGGFGFDAGLREDKLQNMLDQLKSSGCRMDFLSMHVNGLILPEGNCSFRYTTDENEPARRVFVASRLLRNCYPSLPVYITEFGFAHFVKSALNDSLFQAPFVLRFFTENAGRVDGIGYHMMDDLGDYERPAEREFFGGAGLFSTHGLRKPSYYAFSFLSRLGNSVLSMTRNHILTARSRFNYQLVAFHYRHIPDTPGQYKTEDEVRFFEKKCAEAADRLLLQFCISGAAPGTYLTKIIRMSPDVGSLHKLWLYHASSLNSLDEPDYQFFRGFALPEVSAAPLSVPASGKLTVEVLLAPLETVLMLIDRSAV
ncbi:MAG TPA: hypothetical protein DHV42_08895 [Lachnospiraceae bacterium]|nr:hypothetical protein [Lachnospiraceae bacterium]